MDVRCITFIVLFAVTQTFGVPGDPVMYLPPFEVRTLDMKNRPVMLPLSNSQFQQLNFQVPDQETAPTQQEPIIHTTTIPPPPVTEKDNDMKNHNFTFNEFVKALNEVSEQKDEHQDFSRAAGKEYDHPSYSPNPSYSQNSYPSNPPYGLYPRPPAYGYNTRPPSYGSWSPPQHSAYVPPTSVHHMTAKTLKPELTSLLKPVTTKVASKVSGLIDLVLTLFTGSGPEDLELKGFKDIVINGIVKPLLIAKGGIKSLISKLTIPVISLLLINLEVLITVWWLWEDCPEPVVTHPPVYSYPKPPYGYNSYR